MATKLYHGMLEIGYRALPDWNLNNCGNFVNKNPGALAPGFLYLLDNLVDLARENWNCIFEGLVTFCERLEELDIETIIEKEESLLR